MRAERLLSPSKCVKAFSLSYSLGKSIYAHEFEEADPEAADAIGKVIGTELAPEALAPHPDTRMLAVDELDSGLL